MTSPWMPVPVRSQGLAGDAPTAAPATPADPLDVQRFEQALQRGVAPTDPVDPASRAAQAAPVQATDRLGDAILGTLSRLSSLHRETQDRIGAVLAAPDTELTARRMLEVQAALGEHAIVTQFVAGVSTQITRLVDQTVKMQ